MKYFFFIIEPLGSKFKLGVTSLHRMERKIGKNNLILKGVSGKFTHVEHFFLQDKGTCMKYFASSSI